MLGNATRDLQTLGHSNFRVLRSNHHMFIMETSRSMQTEVMHELVWQSITFQHNEPYM